MHLTNYLPGLIISYLSGSIPFALIVTYLVSKKDIRKYGSGNVGATNVSRVIGIKWGRLVFFLDLLKGFLPVIYFPKIFHINTPIFSILLCLSAISGHNWPIFLKFKGGKGVSVSIGVLLAFSWVYPQVRLPLTISLLVWVIIFYSFKIVAIASISCGVCFFVASFIFVKQLEIKIFALIVALFIVIRHIKNIKELVSKSN